MRLTIILPALSIVKRRKKNGYVGRPRRCPENVVRIAGEHSSPLRRRQKGTPPQISSAEADEIHPSDGGELLEISSAESGQKKTAGKNLARRILLISKTFRSLS
jgi:hypothetical protein